MKVSELRMRLAKIPDDLDVCLAANAPKTDKVDGVIEPVDVVEIISFKDENRQWKPIRVYLRAEAEDENSGD